MKNIRFLFIVIFITSVITSCGGSDGGSGDNEEKSKGVSGQAFDAAISQGIVTVFTLNGQRVGRTETNSNGAFSLNDISLNTGDIYKVEITEGSYSEQSGRSRIFLTNEKLLSYFKANGSSNQRVNVNVLTHIQAGFFDFLLAGGDTPDSAFNRSSASIYGVGEFNPVTTTFKDLSDSVTFSLLDDSAKASLFSAAVSHLMHSLLLADGLSLSDQVGSAYTSISFAQNAYLDIVYDGMLNGISNNGQVSFGSKVIETNFYRYDLAVSMIEYLNSNYNQSSLSTTSAYPFAERVSNLLGAQVGTIFGSSQAKALSTIKANVDNILPVYNQPVFGTIDFSFGISDLVGIQSVSLTVGNGDAQFSSDFSSPSFQIDTSLLPDGDVLFKIEVVNYSGQKTVVDHILKVSNAGTTLSNLNPSNQGYVRGIHRFSVNAVDPSGFTYKRYFVGGQQETGFLNSGSLYYKDYNTSNLSDGTYTFKVDFTNTANVVTSLESNFIVDNTKPSITNFDLSEYLFGSVSIAPTISDTNTIQSSSLYIDDSLLSQNIHESTYSLDTISFDEGEHILKVEAVDVAGNVTVKTENVVIDNFPPTVNIVWPQDGMTATSGFTLMWEQADNNPWNGSLTEVWVGGTLYATANAETGQRPININNRPRGNNQIKVIVKDASGKTAEASINVNFQP